MCKRGVNAIMAKASSVFQSRLNCSAFHCPECGPRRVHSWVSHLKELFNRHETVYRVLIPSDDWGMWYKRILRQNAQYATFQRGNELAVYSTADIGESFSPAESAIVMETDADALTMKGKAINTSRGWKLPKRTTSATLLCLGTSKEDFQDACKSVDVPTLEKLVDGEPVCATTRKVTLSEQASILEYVENQRWLRIRCPNLQIGSHGDGQGYDWVAGEHYPNSDSEIDLTCFPPDYADRLVAVF